jgi:hypothetical protein
MVSDLSCLPARVTGTLPVVDPDREFRRGDSSPAASAGRNVSHYG